MLVRAEQMKLETDEVAQTIWRVHVAGLVCHFAL